MAQYDLNLRDYWRIVKKRKFIIIFTMVAMGLFSLVFAVLGKPVPLYRVSASVKVERNTSATGLYIESISWSQTDHIETQTSMIRSYFVIEKAAKKLDLIPPDLPSDEVRANKKYLDIILNLKGRVDTNQEGDTDIIDIEVVSEDSVFAARLANTVAQVYKEERTISLNKRTTEGKRFLESQLEVIKERLRNSEDAVRHFREVNKLISLSSQTSTLLSTMNRLRDTYENSLMDLQKIREVTKLIVEGRDKPLTSKTSYYINEGSSLYKSLNDRLVQMMMQRDTLLLTFTESYPQVVVINKQIEELVTNMKSQLFSQEEILSKSVDGLRKSMEEIDGLVESIPEKGMALARLERTVQVNMAVYTLLETKYQESLIKEAERIEEVEIVKPALESTVPINPTNIWATATVGSIIGLILGIVFAFLIETMDTSIGAIEEVEEFLGVPVLGVIPYVPIQEAIASLEEKYGGELDDETANRNANLVSHFAPKSIRAESYRALRTNLSFSSLERDIKVIVFTSSSPQEGKSSSAINLAITMAQAGNKVLLVDADLRKPVVADLFGMDKTPGLTDFILGNYEWRDIVRTITDIMTGKISIDDIMQTPGIDNLHIITSGTIPPNPADLVASKRLSEFIKEAQAEYDMVLLDAPPILAATDAAILGTKADGVVIVYWVGRVSRGILRRAKAQLDSVKANFMGVILNGLREDVSPDLAGYDYYMKYYGTEGVAAEEEQTFHDKLLSIPGRLADYFRGLLGRGREEESDSSGKKPSRLKIGVLLVALLSLVAGILLQTGHLDFSDTYEGQRENASVKQSGVAETMAGEGAVPVEQQTIQQTDHKPVVSRDEDDEEEVTRLEGRQDAVQSSNETPYAIQIESSCDLEKTKNLVTDLREKGTDSYWEEGRDIVGKGICYRVFVGRFSDREDAVRYMTEKGIDKSYPGSVILKTSSSTPMDIEPSRFMPMGIGDDGEKRIQHQHGYALHVSSFQNEKRAEREVERLVKQGYTASYRPAIVSDKTWFRVYLGDFPDLSSARKAGVELKDKGVISFFLPCKITLGAPI